MLQQTPQYICKSSILCDCIWKDIYSILEVEQHPLKAISRYCSMLQFGPEFQQVAGELRPVRAADVLPQAANQLTDVVGTERWSFTILKKKKK